MFTKYGPQARQVLDALLDKYADQGVEPLEEVQILKIDPFRQFGTPWRSCAASAERPPTNRPSMT